MSDLEKLSQKVVAFREARDWKQFHNPKDMAISLALEASEFLEHFQWKTEKEINEKLKEQKGDLSDELADVFYWVLLIANDLGIDIEKALQSKMKENEMKYPVSKAKGKHTKYTQL